MSFGDRVWDASGNLVTDISIRLGRVLGAITITGNGSLVEAAFSQGTPFFLVGSESGTVTDNPWAWTPTVNVIGTTMSWDFGSLPTSTTHIIYGVY